MLEIDKDAAWDYICNGYLLAPRTVLKGRTKLFPPQLPASSNDLSKFSLIVQQTLESVIGKMAAARCAVMFTGGFDSMLLACLARSLGIQVTAVTIQFDDFNPWTVADAAEASGKLGITHQVIPVTAKEFLVAFEALAGLTDEPLMDLDLAVVYAALKKYNPRTAGDVFISGMGSDQWFGDLALEEAPGGFAARLDWALGDERAHQQVAATHGYKFISPFLSIPMLALAQAVPAAMKKNKKLLRSLPIANSFAFCTHKNELQVPMLIRHIFIKTYGARAWPAPVTIPEKVSDEMERVLRQIILGLWLEKRKY